MDIQKINDFLAKHGSHTLSVERAGSGGVTVGKLTLIEGRKPRHLEYGENPLDSDYVLDVPKTHITALYCCGEVCK